MFGLSFDSQQKQMLMLRLSVGLHKSRLHAVAYPQAMEFVVRIHSMCLESAERTLDSGWSGALVR